MSRPHYTHDDRPLVDEAALAPAALRRLTPVRRRGTALDEHGGYQRRRYADSDASGEKDVKAADLRGMIVTSIFEPAEPSTSSRPKLVWHEALEEATRVE